MMSKEITKLFNNFKEELRRELKVFTVTLERDIRSDIHDMQIKMRRAKENMHFMNLAEDATKMRQSEKAFERVPRSPD